MSTLRERVAKLLHHLSYGEEDDAPSWLLMSEEARGDLLNDADAILSLIAGEPPKEEGMMAIPRYEYYTPPVWDKDSELRVHPDGDWVRYDDHLAEVRERERAAFCEGATWAWGGPPQGDDAEVEALRRHGGEA